MKILTAFMSGVILASGAIVAVRMAAAPTPPDGHSVTVSGVNCPEEDSCTVDYHDGAWHIAEVTP